MNALITEIISPIKLFAGHREETKTTGHGCFMDVIAYLNGDAQITDESECVCPVIRPIAIYINDFINDEQRNRLLPLVERAMRTANAPIEIIVARAKTAAKLALACKTIAKSCTPNTNSHSFNAAAIAASEAVSASEHAAHSVNTDLATLYAVRASRYAVKTAIETVKAIGYVVFDLNCELKITDAGIECLEEMCQPVEITDATVIQRAKNFAEVYKRTAAVLEYAEEAYTRTSNKTEPQS